MRTEIELLKEGLFLLKEYKKIIKQISLQEGKKDVLNYFKAKGLESSLAKKYINLLPKKIQVPVINIHLL